MTFDNDLASRPRLHFTAGKGWINDPVALVRHGGRHHLFYQYVEGSPLWQPAIGWGHASSEDLLSWTEHPPALSPGEGDLGCWSGSLATGDDGRTVLFYTSVNDPDHDIGAIRVASPADDSWETWHKGPVVAHVPDGLGISAFRDPSVFRDGRVWRMLVGAGYNDGRAGVLGFSSEDLHTWRFDCPVAERDSVTMDGVAERDSVTMDGVAAGRLIWECPHLLRLSGSDILFTSVWADGATQFVEVAIGRYLDGRFVATTRSRLTFGGPYAATRFTDEHGQPGLVFWLREVWDERSGWTGALSVPYLISVEDGAVRLTPHAALRSTDAWRTVRQGEAPTRLRLPGGATLEVAGEDGGFTMAAHGRKVTVPSNACGESADLLVDGLVVELCTGSAVASLPIAP